jgi:hypothetical protein
MVVVPRPKVMEWEDPVIPKINNVLSKNRIKGTVDRIPEMPCTSFEVVKERSLTQQLKQILNDEESLPNKSLSREELEATFNAYSPVMIDMMKEELKQEHSNSEKDNKEEEVEERKFLEQQRNSSLGSRAKSKSNKNTPEQKKFKDTVENVKASKNLNSLDFKTVEQREDIGVNKISEEES